MRPGDIKFSVHQYDSDGDVVDEGVFLHFGETMVKASDTVEGFFSIVRHMKLMVQEIKEEYDDEA